MSELQDLMSRRRIDHKSGPLGGRIRNVLKCGKEQKPETQVNGKIIAPIKEFVKKKKEDKQYITESSQRQKKDITEEVGDLRTARRSISPLNDTSDFDDAAFYGFCGDFEQNNERIQNDMEIEMRCRKGIFICMAK